VFSNPQFGINPGPQYREGGDLADAGHAALIQPKLGAHRRHQHDDEQHGVDDGHALRAGKAAPGFHVDSSTPVAKTV